MGSHSLLQGIFLMEPDPGIEPRSPALQVDSFTIWAINTLSVIKKKKSVGIAYSSLTHKHIQLANGFQVSSDRVETSIRTYRLPNSVLSNTVHPFSYEVNHKSLHSYQGLEWWAFLFSWPRGEMKHLPLFSIASSKRILIWSRWSITIKII